ncbi:spermidine synthase [Streptomyces sp. SPB162]|nr:spermidine synthase [Streptomyces sp. SPB162]
MVGDDTGLDPRTPGRRFHAVLLDVDHSPRHVLHPRHAALYQPAGLRALADRLHPGGVFALWSNDPPDQEFNAVLGQVFDRSQAHVVDFDNPLQEGTATNTVYVARTAGP